MIAIWRGGKLLLCVLVLSVLRTDENEDGRVG